LMEANEIQGIIWGELGRLFATNMTCPKCKDVTVMVRLGSSNPAKQNQLRCMRCLGVFEEKVDVSFNEVEDPAKGKE